MPFAGIDHDERAFLALTLYIRYGGRMDDPHVAMARGLLDSAKAAKANILGLALRLGQTLTGGVVTLLQRTALSLDEETLYLILPEDARALIGDTVQRRLDSVAKSLNRRGAIVSRPSRNCAPRAG